MLSYQSLMPAGAGTPRYEKLELWLGSANWHRGFCHVPPLWIPAFAGMTIRKIDGIPRHNRSGVGPFSYQ